MTTQPPAPDWYPDPSGQPGQMYWDGEAWHTPRPADQPPPETATPPPPGGQRPRQRLTWPLIAAIVVILAAAGITFKLLQPHSPAPQTPTAQPAVNRPGMSGDLLV